MDLLKPAETERAEAKREASFLVSYILAISLCFCFPFHAGIKILYVYFNFYFSKGRTQ